MTSEVMDVEEMEVRSDKCCSEGNDVERLVARQLRHEDDLRMGLSQLCLTLSALSGRRTKVIGGRAAIALAISAWHSRAVRKVVDVAVSAEDIIVCGSAIESLLRCPEYGPVQPSRAALACA